MSQFKPRWKFRLSVRGALVIVIAVFALASTQLTVHSQLGGIPQSPNDSTVTPQETVLSDAQKDAAFSTLMDQGNMQNIGKTVGMKDPKNEWTTKSELLTKEGSTTKYRLSQVYKGIKVHNGNLTVRMADGASSPDLTSAHINYMLDPEVDTTPTLSNTKAMDIAKKLAKSEVDKLGGPAKDNGNSKDQPDKKLALSGPAGDSASLEVHPGGGPGKRKLSWHVSTTDHAVGGPVQMEAWVDQAGNILEAYNNAQPYALTGYGYTYYQGFQYMTVDYNSCCGGYVINDNSLLIGTYDNYGTTGSTYQASYCCGPYFGNYALSNRNSTNADVYTSTVQTLSFMYYILGRDFVDGNRGPRYYNSVSGPALISARNHYGSNYVNAFYSGGVANFGDGDGNLSGPLTSLYIVAHEWQHGVTAYTAGLIYMNESGAINDSFSDIMGSMAERYWRGESLNYLNDNCNLAGHCNTWKVGEEAWTPGVAGDALRYMDEPWRAGNPWHYSQRYTGTSDNGGVHSNSGISNFAFFVTSKGWPGVNGGIGADAARFIFYTALRDCMIPTDGFFWTRWCTQYEAAYYYGYGSYAYNNVRAAWDFVGAPGPGY